MGGAPAHDFRQGDDAGWVEENDADRPPALESDWAAGRHHPGSGSRTSRLELHFACRLRRASPRGFEPDDETKGGVCWTRPRMKPQPAGPSRTTPRRTSPEDPRHRDGHRRERRVLRRGPRGVLSRRHRHAAAARTFSSSRRSPDVCRWEGRRTRRRRPSRSVPRRPEPSTDGTASLPRLFAGWPPRSYINVPSRTPRATRTASSATDRRRRTSRTAFISQPEAASW